MKMKFYKIIIYLILIILLLYISVEFIVSGGNQTFNNLFNKKATSKEDSTPKSLEELTSLIGTFNLVSSNTDTDNVHPENLYFFANNGAIIVKNDMTYYGLYDLQNCNAKITLTSYTNQSSLIKLDESMILNYELFVDVIDGNGEVFLRDENNATYILDFYSFSSDFYPIFQDWDYATNIETFDGNMNIENIKLDTDFPNSILSYTKNDELISKELALCCDDYYMFFYDINTFDIYVVLPLNDECFKLTSTDFECNFKAIPDPE